MKRSRYNLKIGIAGSVLLATIAVVVIFSNKMTDFTKQEEVLNKQVVSGAENAVEVVEETVDTYDPGNPMVVIKDDQFVFLSGGTESTMDSDLVDYVQVETEEGFGIYTSDWQLDSYTLSASRQMAIYGAFHPKAKLYRVYRYDASINTSVVLQEFDITDSPIFDVGHVHLPFTTMDLAPDEQHVYVLSIRFDHKNYIGLDPHSFVLSLPDGEMTTLALPETVYQEFWFTNYEIAFSGANFGGSLYVSPYIEIYNINTHEIASTKIPVRGAFSGLEPKINPDASAYAYYDHVANHGYACGGSIYNLVVRSYPDGEILFRLDNLHKLSYRWVNDTELEITYTRTPLPLDEYPTKKQMGTEVIQCLEEEQMIYQVTE